VRAESEETDKTCLVQVACWKICDVKDPESYAPTACDYALEWSHNRVMYRAHEKYTTTGKTQ